MAAAPRTGLRPRPTLAQPVLDELALVDALAEHQRSGLPGQQLAVDESLFPEIRGTADTEVLLPPGSGRQQ
jgi:hypothetical protein